MIDEKDVDIDMNTFVIQMNTTAVGQTTALLKAIETGEAGPVGIINPD